MVDITTHELELPPEENEPSDPKTPAPKIAWLAVEPRHYTEAQRIKKDDGADAYRMYILALIFSIDGQQAPFDNLPQKTKGQVVKAFEERFGESKSPGGIGGAL